MIATLFLGSAVSTTKNKVIMDQSKSVALPKVVAFLSGVLQWITIFLMVLLTFIVSISVIARLMGQSFSWYDELAAILLAWITYYGSALAALHRRHIGFDTVLLHIPVRFRMVAVLVGEAIVLLFFFLMARAGLQVLEVLEGDSLISLTWVPVQFTQSVIPIGAILFMLCQVLSLPNYWKLTASGISLEHAEIEEEVETELEKNKDRI
jgi:TRAP-type C4-dicarboxylate transport system permease small subunit